MVARSTELIVPSKEHILEALRLSDPENQAQEHHKHAMKFPLATAVPAVVPRVLRDPECVKNKTTYVKFFGDSCVFEMATALLLVLQYR